MHSSDCISVLQISLKLCPFSMTAEHHKYVLEYIIEISNFSDNHRNTSAVVYKCIAQVGGSVGALSHTPGRQLVYTILYILICSGITHSSNQLLFLTVDKWTVMFRLMGHTALQSSALQDFAVLPGFSGTIEFRQKGYTVLQGSH